MGDLTELAFLGDHDDTRYCYMRLGVLERLLADERVLDSLIIDLRVPGRPAALKKLSPREKLKAIEAQLEHERRTKTSQWHGTPVPEIVAALIFDSEHVAERTRFEAFGDVTREADLALPVAGWLAKQGYEAFAEVPLGTKRIDLLGYRKGSWISNESSVGVELKNDIKQLERGLDQMTTFADYTAATYLACPPALAAEYLHKHAKGSNVDRWDAEVFERKVTKFGFGLLLVEGAAVFECMKPKRREPSKALAGQVKEALSKCRRLA